MDVAAKSADNAIFFKSFVDSNWTSSPDLNLLLKDVKHPRWKHRSEIKKEILIDIPSEQVQR